MVRLGRGFPPGAMIHQPPPVLRVLPDAVGPGAQIGASGSYVHPVGSGASLVLVGLSLFASGPGSITVTLGGTAMTLVQSYQYYSNGVNSSGQVTVYSMFSPPKGSQTVAISMTGGYSAASVNSVSYAGVKSIGAYAVVSGSSAAPSQSSTGGDPFGGFFQMFGSYANFTSYSQTERWLANVSGNAHSLVMGDALWQAAPVFNAPLASSNVWGGIVVPLLAH